MKANLPEIELTAEDITAGSKHEKRLVLKSDNPNYNGKTIKYKTLTATEFDTVMSSRNLHSGDVKFSTLVKICEIGILNPGVGKNAGTLDYDLIVQIGNAIIGASKPDEKKVTDFSEGQKDSS